MAKDKEFKRPKCVDCKKSCHWYEAELCKLFTTENKDCSFFKTNAQVRDAKRAREHLLKWKVR